MIARVVRASHRDVPVRRDPSLDACSLLRFSSRIGTALATVVRVAHRRMRKSTHEGAGHPRARDRHAGACGAISARARSRLRVWIRRALRRILARPQFTPLSDPFMTAQGAASGTHVEPILDHLSTRLS
ncbi:MAG TPA: hypothetical protein VI238_18690, partial [Dokdonella sp.]